ncbi:MAG: MFS transporter [Ignisphaera sp.]
MSDPFKEFEEAKLNNFHWKAVLIAGTGSFTDGYDLTSIAVVLSLVASEFSFSTTSNEAALLTSSALIGTVIGALIFGYLVNLGRKKFYGFDALILGIGALSQFFVQNYWQLVIARFVLGIGVGADYVISPLIVAEYSNRFDRGKLITFGWSLLWNIGAIVAGVVYLVLQSFFPAPLLWRLVLAIGAIPAFIVVYFRRRFPETVRYILRIKGDFVEYKSLLKYFGRESSVLPSHEISKFMDKRPIFHYFREYYKILAIISGLYFIYGIISYVNILFGPSVIGKQIGITSPALFQVIINSAFVVPGTLLNFFPS